MGWLCWCFGFGDVYLSSGDVGIASIAMARISPSLSTFPHEEKLRSIELSLSALLERFPHLDG